MRRTAYLCLLLALLLAMSACGANAAAEPTATDIPISSPTNPPVTSTPNILDSLFGFTREGYINMVDPYLEEQGYTKLSDIVPVIADHYDSNLGTCMVYIYVLDDGSDLRFYEPAAYFEPAIMFFLVEKDTNVDDTYEFSYLSELTISLFEEDIAASIIEKLGLSNTADFSATTAESDELEYCYAVCDSNIQFLIYKK